MITLSPRLSIGIVVLITGLAATLAGAPQAQTTAPAKAATPPPAAETAPLKAEIPTDPQITTGTYANGMRYYIRRNRKPENRAELRLVVNAGSVLEEDDQLGLAHFVEHMAFNGTKHFPKLEIVSFMESIGMRFGPSVNAFTSFDETVYQLQIPTDRADVIDRSLLILEDWAQNVSFDPEEIDKERGVITEEWRLRRGASARIQDKQFPVLLQGSRYADRLPIGKMDVVQKFKHERLTQFYKDWYRPDLMAVIAVGDFNPVVMQQLLNSHFGSLLPAKAPKKRPVYTVPDHGGTSYTIATDKELTGTQVTVYNLQKARDESTIGAYRQQIVEGLFSGMLNSRLGEIAEKPDAPFLNAGVGHGSFVRTAEATTLGAIVKEGGIEKGLASVFAEAERVTKFGFTATELARHKTSILRSLEDAVTEKDNQQSAPLAAELSRNFLENEPIPGIVYESALYHRFVPTVTLAEINALAKAWWPDRNRIVAVSAPDKPGVTMPTQAALAESMKRTGKTVLTAYVDKMPAGPLLDAAPAPGRVTGTSTKSAIGITEWKLSNGATVILKPTTFKQDEIVVRAFSFGGSSLASEADWIAATTASQVVSAGGLGKLSSTELGKALTGKIAVVRPSISLYDEGLSGAGSVKDLDTLFQLIYLTFTQPRADPDIFKVIVDQTKISLTNQTAQPEYWFGQAFTSALYQDHPRTKPLTLETIGQMNLDKSLAFYKDRFADASDFTFVFVGSFEPDALKPLVEQYLAALPSTGRKENWKDLGIRYPSTVVERRVQKGIEAKSQTYLVYTGKFDYDVTHRIALGAMTSVLQTRLRNALREELGGTYSVSVGGSPSKIPTGQYLVQINFSADPAKLDTLVTRTAAEVEKFKVTLPSEQEVNDVKETLLRDYETNMKTNGYLADSILGRYRNGENVETLFTLDAVYKALTPASIQDAAKTYLNPASMVKAVLVPEKIDRL